MPNSKQIVYLSQAQYAELIANGTITVDGVTVTYDENDIYVTPQAEPVTDVRINGTSIAANGVANIPLATDTSHAGVVKAPSESQRLTQGTGVYVSSSGLLSVTPANTSNLKSGSSSSMVVVPSNQHEATFYGLAKVSGDTTQSQSSNAVGTYTPEAKGAIQQMLGVSDLIATSEPTLVASKAYAVGDVFTANGKLYKAIAAIAANDTIVLQNEGETISGANAVECKVSERFVKFTDYATQNTPGVIKVFAGYGLYLTEDGVITFDPAPDNLVKLGNSQKRIIAPYNQHVSTFYGLAKAAGDTTQSASDNAVGTYTDDAKAAIRTMLGAVGTEDYATSSTAGIVSVSSDAGIMINSSTHRLSINQATAAQIKTGTALYYPIVPQTQHNSVFYGLAKAAGDTTMSSSSNAVGTYTDNAKASIKQMLGIVDGSTGTVNVSGAAPSITAIENTRYVCGEVTSLSFTPAASGICIVRFTSGSTATLLTVPNTVKFPEWFDSTSLETNTIYEICVTDGVYGAVMLWAQ